MLESSTQTYPLTTIDVCNLAAKPSGERYRVLRDWKKPRIWVSYVPTKSNWSKLIARNPSLDLDLGEDDKASLMGQIALKCRHGDADVQSNVAAAEAIWNWATEKGAKSICHSFEPYRTSLSVNHFFEEGIILVGEKGYGIFLDTRRSGSCLDKRGRDFLFSAMHWRVAGNYDYADLSIGLLRLTDSKPQRRAQLVEFNGQPVFSQSEIVDRIEETQRIWLDIQLERRDRASRADDSG